jgi:hypothetical protein
MAPEGCVVAERFGAHLDAAWPLHPPVSLHACVRGGPVFQWSLGGMICDVELSADGLSSESVVYHHKRDQYEDHETFLANVPLRRGDGDPVAILAWCREMTAHVRTADRMLPRLAEALGMPVTVEESTLPLREGVLLLRKGEDSRQLHRVLRVQIGERVWWVDYFDAGEHERGPSEFEVMQAMDQVFLQWSEEIDGLRKPKEPWKSAYEIMRIWLKSWGRGQWR